eukprot:3284573-Pleurochrysis_carterae.AAC.1
MAGGRAGGRDGGREGGTTSFAARLACARRWALLAGMHEGGERQQQQGSSAIEHGRRQRWQSGFRCGERQEAAARVEREPQKD